MELLEETLTKNKLKETTKAKIINDLHKALTDNTVLSDLTEPEAMIVKETNHGISGDLIIECPCCPSQTPTPSTTSKPSKQPKMKQLHPIGSAKIIGGTRKKPSQANMYRRIVLEMDKVTEMLCEDERKNKRLQCLLIECFTILGKYEKWWWSERISHHCIIPWLAHL